MKKTKKKPLWFWIIVGFFALNWLYQLFQALSYIFYGEIVFGLSYIAGATFVLAIVYFGLKWWISK